MAVLINAKIDSLLERTSRSFYPTLKYLPKKIRGQIGLLYLMARVADTIADSKHGETSFLQNLLEQYNDGLYTKHIARLYRTRWYSTERTRSRTLQMLSVLNGLEVYDAADRSIILECLDVIVGGQLLDLQRFGPANEGGKISSLKSNEELDDYTYRVAGCVGVFWSKMSLEHVISLPSEKQDEFFEKGIRFGKALQMINILRDIQKIYVLADATFPAKNWHVLG